MVVLIDQISVRDNFGCKYMSLIHVLSIGAIPETQLRVYLAPSAGVLGGTPPGHRDVHTFPGLL